MMYCSLLILIFINLSNGEDINHTKTCNGFQANFNFKDIIGTWHVVAIIPEKLFPEREVTCYKIEISETDEAGLRWLVNKTKSSASQTLLPDEIKGNIVRQRYHTEHPFDVWAKSVEGVSGCFQQVLSLDLENNDIHKTLKTRALMQLHLMEAADGTRPFLLQILWGRMVSVVIYRRNQGVTQEELRIVFELMTKLRGPQRAPKICDNPIKDLLIF